MINQQQYLNQAPQYNSFHIKPKPYLQVNQFTNNINPVDEDLTQGVIPFNADQGTVYYSDLEEQTCTNLRTFVKQPKEKHICMMLFTIFMFVMCIIYIALFSTAFKRVPWIAAQLIGIPYIFNLVLGLCVNPFSQYSSTMKNVSQADEAFEDLKRRTGHIHFKAECYHFTGGKHRRRVVTHTAQHMMPVRECVDASESISQLKEDKSRYILCKIKKFYFFADSNSHNTFINTFSLFKNSNIQDTYQKYTHSLDLTMPNFSEEIGFSANGNGEYLKPMFFIFLLLGLGYPYVMAFECMSQRYSINLTKRLSL